MERSNEINNYSDVLDSFAQLPREAEYYRTSTDRDEFVAPQLPDDDSQENEIESESDEPNKPNDEIFRIIEEMLLKGVRGKEVTTQRATSTEMAKTENATTERVKQKAPAHGEGETTAREAEALTTTEKYVPRTLKRPAQQPSIKGVLKAFRVLNNWKFNE